MRFRTGAALVVGLLGGVTVAGVSPAAAAARPGEVEWCYTNVLSPEQMAAGAGNDIRCFRSEREMEADAEGGGRAEAGILSFTNQRLARHYDQTGGSGSSLSVYGADCAGGGISLVGGAWDQRIRSTRHGACGTIGHYTSGSYGGSQQVTSGGCSVVRTLGGTVIGNVRSILYFTPEQGSCHLG